MRAVNFESLTLQERAPATAEAFSAQLRADLERWRRVVVEAKIPRE